MVDPAEVRATQAGLVAGLQELALDVERSLHLGVGVPDDELGAWMERVERAVGQSSADVLQAARELRRVLA